MKHPDIWKIVNTTDNCKSKSSSIARGTKCVSRNKNVGGALLQTTC